MKKRFTAWFLAIVLCVSILPHYQVSAASNEQIIYNYLVNSGFNTAAAVGILANVAAESSFNPNAQGDYVNGVATSYGICQWHNDRWTNLKNYRPSDWQTLNGQLAFLVYELQSSRKTINNYMRYSIANTADGAYEAGRYWCYYFEVPANRDSVSVTRGNNARSTYWPKYCEPTAYLDVNGILNGTSSGSLGSYGTCDVYINGSLVANDVNDYCVEWKQGTTFAIRDIKPNAGYTYSGNSSYSGTIGTSTTYIDLPFDSYGTLTVKGRLDGTVYSDLGGYGTFDVYINGRAVGTGLTSYSQKWPKGTTYEIKNARPAGSNYLYDGLVAGDSSGTLGNSAKTVTLSFTAKGIPTGEWTVSKVLPSNITSDYCDIEYRHTYQKTATASPGYGWTQVPGSGVTTYQNSGNIEEYYIPRTQSNTYVLVGTYYYHYCDPSSGRVNYEEKAPYTTFHGPNPVDSFDVVRDVGDDDSSEIRVYLLNWKAGHMYSGSALCATQTSAWWYKMYQYQPRVAVTTYTWTKTTDWTAAKDTSASSIEYRYRLKDSEKPVINSVKVTEITPDSFTITCTATDDSGIAKIAASGWTDTETEASAAVTEVVPDKVEKTVEVSVTIPIADHLNERDVNYNTKIKVYDKVGNTVDYTKTLRVYIPMLIRSSKQLTLPANLKEIGEEAFEGSTAFGEVILPDGVLKIGSRAFADCSRLVFISIPDSVTEIGKDAFAGDSNLVILCSIDSAAAAYAAENGIPYITKE